MSADELLVHSDASLADLLGISITSCRKLLHAVAGPHLGSPKTGFEVFAMNELKIGTSLSSLDSAFHGGLQKGWLCELFGEAGSGKTQMCFTITAHALRSGREVFWIDSEGSFRPERIMEIYGPGGNEVFENLHVCKCGSMSEMMEVIDGLLPTLSSRSDPGLIVVDSVAALVRGLFPNALAQRQKSLHQFAVLVRKLNATTICTNHVKANMGSPAVRSSGILPALGNTWSHDVTCRLWMRMSDENAATDRNCRHRWVEIQKCPGSPPVNISVKITSHGVVEV